MTNQLLPQSIEAEQALLGGCLIDPTAISRISYLQADDFCDKRHRQIFGVMLDLIGAGSPSDVVTVGESLGADSLSYLAGLSSTTPTSLHVDHYAAIVVETATKRRLIEIGRKIADYGYDSDQSADDAIALSESMLLQLSQGQLRGDFKTIASVHDRRIGELEQIRKDPHATVGLPTGLLDLDRYLAGLRPGNYVLLAARPGMGKSALAANIALNVAREGKHVAIFSFEMGDDDLHDRLIACIAKINLQNLQTGSVSDGDWDRVKAAGAKLRTMPIHLEDTFEQTITAIRAKARRMAMKTPDLGLIIVDYIGLIEGQGENQNQVVSAISRTFKTLANELNIPFLVLSQLNRKVEDRPNRRPQQSDLRDSGSLEQDPDVILFLYRDVVYDANCDNPRSAEIIVSKNRNGPRGRVDLFFDETTMRFANLSPMTEVAV